MPKNAYFLEKKTVKIPRFPPAGGWGLRPLDPRIVTPAYYYNFVEFASIVKCVL